MEFFCSYEGKSFLKIKSHLVTKTTFRSCSRSVGFFNAIIEYMLKEIKILLHGCKLGKRLVANTCEKWV